MRGPLFMRTTVWGACHITRKRGGDELRSRVLRGNELEVGEGTDTRDRFISVTGRGRREAQRERVAWLGQNKEAGSLCSLSKAHLTS